MLAFSKYWAVIRYMIIRTLEYRVEMWLWIVLDSLPFLVLFWLWQAAYAGHDTIRGLTLGQTVQYYLLVMIIHSVVEVHFEEWRSNEVRNGKIDHFLTRPFTYLEEIFWKDIGGKAIFMGMYIPFLGVCYWLASHWLALPPLVATGTNWLLLAALLVTAYLINFMIGLWIVLGTFWLEGSQGLVHFKWMVLQIFTGSLLPLVMLPAYLRQWVEWLPFKFFYAIPIQLAQGQYHWQWSDLLYLSGFFVGSWVVTRWLWQRALYKYCSAGG